MALKNFIKENFVLVTGLALPVLLVIFFFVFSVLPKSMAVPPQYEMLFTTTRYDYQNPPPYNIDFFVKDGALKARVSKNIKQPAQNYNKKTLMAYDGKTQSVREIPYDTSKAGDVPDGTEVVFDEFKSMKLDNSNKAPDGYEFDNAGYGSGGFAYGLFGGGYRGPNARVVKGAVAFKIPGNNGNNYYAYDIQFLGWVLGK